MKAIKTILLVSCLTGLFTACNRDIEEFRFTGHVVGAEMCSSSLIGYVIDIISDNDIGVEFTTADGKFNKCVMGYRASRILHQDDTIYGVASPTKSFAALNCFGIINKDLPEVILLSVDEDPE